MRSGMPLFEGRWFYFGLVSPNEIEDFKKLTEKYKVKYKTEEHETKTCFYLNDPWRVDSIRKRLWGHRWAVYKNWLKEHPQWEGYDPRVEMKNGKLKIRTK